ncbi:CDP-glycerol glycerophosphotransferase family protein [Pseudoalteromonas sp. MB47]|uniref:CDP-glycerol glycerophosphotransferase family protein n=1 Tax=Pseudoalteromonas sp. MB47 TaxID=2588452 RepID=UPI00140C6434|nr:CDP-glycerol glycerophosphotransferase family protein [Pseudoalteromonas sp. MB47]NHH91310.1 hypothetical protein [Pseudoalteromonas sp. MB47]
MQLNLAIVGAGSFGQKVANSFLEHKLPFQLYDRQVKAPFKGINVYPLENLSPQNTSKVLLAVSVEPYISEIKDELLELGFKANQIIPLVYDSAAVLLDTMLKKNKSLTVSLLKNDYQSFSALESDFFSEREQRISHLIQGDKDNIGFYYLGRGGGFRKHTGNLPALLESQYNVITFSDELPYPNENAERYIYMSQETMLQCDFPKLAITTNFYPCSPKATTKLTMMHMAYDFLLFSKETAKGIKQAENHYIFLASQPSLELHKRICLEEKLTNNVVLIPGGYPRHDQNLLKYEKIKNITQSEAIIYAPTLSSLLTANDTKYTYSIIQAVTFIPMILKAFPERTLIFRPHPEDLDLIASGIQTQRAQAFRELLTLCENHPKCVLDNNKTNYIESFAKSAVMISDTSAIAFSYFLTTGKPVIFFSPDQKALKDNLGHIRYIQDREKIGYCVDNINGLIETLEKILLNNKHVPPSKDGIIFNEGHSEQYLLENLDYILSGKKHPDWWYLQDYLKEKGE